MGEEVKIKEGVMDAVRQRCTGWKESPAASYQSIRQGGCVERFLKGSRKLRAAGEPRLASENAT